MQNIRNNKNHRRTPKWIQKYGLVDTSEIKRKERKSQWANRYNERLPQSALQGRPYEEGQEGGSSIDISTEDQEGRRVNGNGELWDRNEEQYYSQSNDSTSSGRWHYPANFEDAETPSRKKSKKSKKDRFARTEDAYSVTEAEPSRRRKSKKKRRSTVVETDSYRSNDSTSEFPEDPEGGLYGDHRPAADRAGEQTQRQTRTTDDEIFSHEL